MANPNSRTEFDEFVARQKEAASQAPDKAQVIKEWQHHLDALYSDVDKFLQKHLESGDIEREYVDIDLNEERLGSYRAKSMVIRIGAREVALKPVGTNVIGAKGRVDLVGPLGQHKFVLVGKDAQRPRINVSVQIAGEESPKRRVSKEPTEWRWKIATPPPAIQYIELNPDTFYRALMEVAGG